MAPYALPMAALAGGILLLVWGGDRLVRHSATLAVAYRVPKVVVGAIIIGFGTSLPELFVSLTAALRGSPGIALGNVVGSNIANVGLILGLGALLTTLHVPRSVLRADLPMGVLAALFLIVWAGPSGEVSRIAGVFLLVSFVFYLALSLRHTRNERLEGGLEEAHAEKRPLRDGLWILAGLIGVAGGAHFLVHGATEVARLAGVSERVIGLTVVAVGTSLPELAAIIVAARRGESDLAVGNVAGSNLFNLLFVLGTTASVKSVPVDSVSNYRDFPILAGFSVLAFPLLVESRRIHRLQGLLLLACYAGYLLWTWGILG